MRLIPTKIINNLETSAICYFFNVNNRKKDAFWIIN